MTRIALAALPLLLAACQQVPPRDPASAAAAAACRERVDQVYAQQNRVELSLRDQRDAPFASSYNSGITTRGLGAQYSRGSMFNECLSQAANSQRGTSGAARAATGGGVTGGGGQAPGATGSAMSPIAR